jgi:ATPase family AAA domain-containing protein 1
MARKSETSLVQELVLYAVSAALSSLVLYVGLRQLDPNRSSNKKAMEQKKAIAKRLGRPLVNTNSYEVFFLVFVPLLLRVKILAQLVAYGSSY